MFKSTKVHFLCNFFNYYVSVKSTQVLPVYKKKCNGKNLVCKYIDKYRRYFGQKQYLSFRF